MKIVLKEDHHLKNTPIGDLLEEGYTPEQLSGIVQVEVNTVNRWIGTLTPGNGRQFTAQAWANSQTREIPPPVFKKPKGKKPIPAALEAHAAAATSKDDPSENSLFLVDVPVEKRQKFIALVGMLGLKTLDMD